MLERSSETTASTPRRSLSSKGIMMEIETQQVSPTFRGPSPRRSPLLKINSPSTTPGGSSLLQRSPNSNAINISHGASPSPQRATPNSSPNRTRTMMAKKETKRLPPPASTGTSTTKTHQAVLWVTYVNIVLYALCYHLQQPVIPFLVGSLSANADDADRISQRYGELESFFSTIQTLGSPFVGILLDRVGIRRASVSGQCTDLIRTGVASFLTALVS